MVSPGPLVVRAGVVADDLPVRGMCPQDGGDPLDGLQVVLDPPVEEGPVQRRLQIPEPGRTGRRQVGAGVLPELRPAPAAAAQIQQGGGLIDHQAVRAALLDQVVQAIVVGLQEILVVQARPLQSPDPAWLPVLEAARHPVGMVNQEGVGNGARGEVQVRLHPMPVARLHHGFRVLHQLGEGQGSDQHIGQRRVLGGVDEEVALPFGEDGVIALVPHLPDLLFRLALAQLRVAEDPHAQRVEDPLVRPGRPPVGGRQRLGGKRQDAAGVWARFRRWRRLPEADLIKPDLVARCLLLVDTEQNGQLPDALVGHDDPGDRLAPGARKRLVRLLGYPCRPVPLSLSILPVDDHHRGPPPLLCAEGLGLVRFPGLHVDGVLAGEAGGPCHHQGLPTSIAQTVSHRAGAPLVDSPDAIARGYAGRGGLLEAGVGDQIGPQLLSLQRGHWDSRQQPHPGTELPGPPGEALGGPTSVAWHGHPSRCPRQPPRGSGPAARDPHGPVGARSQHYSTATAGHLTPSLPSGARVPRRVRR